MFPFLRPRWAGSRLQVVQEVGSKCLLDFSLEEKLGSGVFGDTFAVTDQGDAHLQHKGQMVLKIVQINRPDIGRPGGLAMFESEVSCALVASRLGLGPHLFRAWRCDDKGYLLMERCKPVTSATLRNQGFLDELALAIYKFSAFGLMHNDLHEDNVMQRMETDRPVLIDFGMATTIGASSGYNDVLRLKAEYGIDTASAATVLTLDELNLYEPKSVRLVRYVDTVRRRVSNEHQHQHDMVVDMEDIDELAPRSG